MENTYRISVKDLSEVADKSITLEEFINKLEDKVGGFNEFIGKNFISTTEKIRENNGIVTFFKVNNIISNNEGIGEIHCDFYQFKENQALREPNRVISMSDIPFDSFMEDYVEIKESVFNSLKRDFNENVKVLTPLVRALKKAKMKFVAKLGDGAYYRTCIITGKTNLSMTVDEKIEEMLADVKADIKRFNDTVSEKVLINKVDSDTYKVYACEPIQDDIIEKASFVNCTVFTIRKSTTYHTLIDINPTRVSIRDFNKTFLVGDDEVNSEIISHLNTIMKANNNGEETEEEEMNESE